MKYCVRLIFIQFEKNSDYQWLSGKKSASNVRGTAEAGSIPGSGRSPGRGHGTTPVFLPGKYHGQRSLAGYNLWDHKESDTTKQLSPHINFVS